MRRWLMATAAAMATALILASSAAAQWKQPADNVFTEDQLNTYIATTNDWLDENAKIMQQLSEAKTTEGRIAAVTDLDKKHQACLDRHHISQAEYDWMGQQAITAYGVAVYAQDAYEKAEADLQARFKENDDKLADAQKRLATYQAAAKDGRRVMTSEERDAAIKSAQSDQKAALEEVKLREEEAKTAETEAQHHDADAKAADDLAANPPADVSADDRPSYIESKKNEAQAARDAAKDARGRQADAEKAKADALAKAQAAANVAAHPDLPVTDDDKASVKAANDAAIAQAQSDIVQCQQSKEQLALVEAQLKKNLDEMLKQSPTQNVALMRKHLDDYKKMFDRSARGGAASQPSP